jgi:hypothetical protein
MVRETLRAPALTTTKGLTVWAYQIGYQQGGNTV